MLRSPASISHRASTPFVSSQADEGHGDDRHHPGRREHQPRVQGRVAHQELEELGQEHGAAVHHREHEVGDRRGDREVAVLEEAEVDDRVRVPELVEHRPDQRRDAHDRHPHDERRAEPVVGLALVEHDLQRGQADRQSAEPEQVELFLLPPPLAPQGGQEGRVLDARCSSGRARARPRAG